MRIDIATLFPEMCEAVLSESIIGRARKSGAIEIHCHNIRDYTLDKHRRVDDTPYGGGMGMLMQAEPVWRCWLAVCEMLGKPPHSIYLSPKGETLTQQKTVQLSQKENLFLLCGHYEGIDQRVLDEIIDEEISIGDYVLTGGELAGWCRACLRTRRAIPARAIGTGCWNIRSIPVRNSGTASLYRKYYCPVII